MDYTKIFNNKETLENYKLQYLTSEQIDKFTTKWIPNYSETLIFNKLINIEKSIKDDLKDIKSLVDLFNNNNVQNKIISRIKNILFTNLLTISNVDLDDLQIKAHHNNIVVKCVCIRYYIYCILKSISDSEEYLEIDKSENILQLYNYIYENNEFINKPLFKVKLKYINNFNSILYNTENINLSNSLLYCIQIDKTKKNCKDIFNFKTDFNIQLNLILYMIFNNLKLSIFNIEDFTKVLMEEGFYYYICTQAFATNLIMITNNKNILYYEQYFNRYCIYKDFLKLYQSFNSGELFEFIYYLKHIIHYPALVQELFPINIKDNDKQKFDKFFLNFINLLELTIIDEVNCENAGNYISNIWKDYLQKELDEKTKLLFNNTLLYSNNNELYQNIANNRPGIKTLTFVYNKSNSKESMEWNKYIEKKLNLYQGTVSSNKYTYDNY